MRCSKVLVASATLLSFALSVPGFAPAMAQTADKPMMHHHMMMHTRMMKNHMMMHHKMMHHEMMKAK
jgi:hypothetical protein